MIPIYKPYLPKSSLIYAHEALDSTWISSQGKYIQLATEKLQELLNIKYALPVFNGTVACHLVAKALKRKYNLDEIIVPNNVYVAAWNAFIFDGDWKLFSVECDENTWNYDLEALDIAITTHPKAAVLLVHNIGGIINQPELQRKYPNTIFVEDACEGLLGKYDGYYAGTKSFCSAISFFANKTLTAGESGVLLCEDEETYLYAKCIHSQGQSNKRFIHNELGYNYRITNIQAALLVGQIELVDQIVKMKKNILEKYRIAFKDREDIFIQNDGNNTQHSNWMMGVRIPNNTNFDEANLFFAARDIEIRPLFYALSEHGHIKNNKNVVVGDCKNAVLLNKQGIVLPSFPELTNEEQNYILKTVNEYIRDLK